MPYHSSDIGGFYGSQQPTAELYVRWLQATVFCSHIRVHGIGEREPWAFGPEVEAVCRKWLAFRYRLIPYLSGDRRRRRHGHAGDARDAARVSRQCAHARLRDAVHVRRCAAGRADRARGRRGRDRACRRAAGTTSTRGSASPAGSVLRYARSSTSFRCSGAKATRCRWAARSSTPARSTRRKPLEQLWVFGKPTRPFRASRRRSIVDDADGASRSAWRADVKVGAVRRCGGRRRSAHA